MFWALEQRVFLRFHTWEEENDGCDVCFGLWDMGFFEFSYIGIGR